MSDESRRRNEDGPRFGISRRRFIQGTVAAMGAAGFALGQRTTSQEELVSKPFIPDGPESVDCGCVNEAALPLISAASIGGKYFGLVGDKNGPQIYSLNIDKGGQLSPESPLKTDLPDGFVFGSIGIARGGLVISGGLPFVVETYEVDNEMSEDVRAAMDNDVPPGIPTTGRERVDVMGLQPALFIVNGSSTAPILLPDMPKRSFAVAAAVTESNSGGLSLLVEHSDGINESYYASAIDVVEESKNGWQTWSAGRALGESGPNHLAVSANGLAVGVNTEQGSYLASPDTVTAKAPILSSQNRIVTLVSNADGSVTALTTDQTGKRVWSSVSAEGRFTAGAAVEMAGDEVIGAVAVSGTKGEIILLGRRSSALVNNIPAFVSRANGGRI